MFFLLVLMLSKAGMSMGATYRLCFVLIFETSISCDGNSCAQSRSQPSVNRTQHA